MVPLMFVVFNLRQICGQPGRITQEVLRGLGDRKRGDSFWSCLSVVKLLLFFLPVGALVKGFHAPLQAEKLYHPRP